MVDSRKVQFSKKRIEVLECPSDKKQIYFSDSIVRGLLISVTRGGTKSFIHSRKIDGVTRRTWLGYFPDMTVEQARGKAAELDGNIALGIDYVSAQLKEKNELSLQQLFDQYIERHAKKARKTWSDMEENFRRTFEGDKLNPKRAVKIDLRKMKLSKITSEMAESFHTDLSEKRGQFTANRMVQLLRAVFFKGKKWKLFVGDNPFAGITLFEEKPRKRFLSKDETVKLLSALEIEADRTLRDFIKLSLFTGIRKSNLMSLSWDNVDFNSGVLIIPDTKNGEAQEIMLGGVEIQLLFARKQMLIEQNLYGKYVFPGAGRTGHLTDLKKGWTAFRTKLGFIGDKHLTIHDLRRSLGAAMANANVNVALVKAALNHKDLKTTLKVYALTEQEAVREARNKVHSAWTSEKRNLRHDAGA